MEAAKKLPGPTDSNSNSLGNIPLKVNNGRLPDEEQKDVIRDYSEDSSAESIKLRSLVPEKIEAKIKKT